MTELLREIDKVKDRGAIVIVEGIKDKGALEELGFKNIVVFQGKPRYKKYEEITDLAKRLKAEAVILTDLDRKGRQLYGIIKKELSNHGVKVNDSLRRALLKEKISHVEGLATFVNIHHNSTI